MILACPACRATFKIPDGAIPPGGRKVRCAKCKHSWHTDPETIQRQQKQLEAAAFAAATARQVAAQRAAAAQPRPQVQAPVTPPPRPQAPPPVPQQNFDGRLDPVAAETAASLRQTVKGVVETKQTTINDVEEDPLFEDDGSEAGPPISREVGGDDFGISAAFKEGFTEESDADDDYGDDDYDAEDFLTRRRADQRRQYMRAISDRRDKLISAGWIGLIIFWVITLYVFIFEKDRMVDKFPGTQALYSITSSMDEKDLYRPEPGEKLTPSKAKAEVYISAKLDPARTKIDLVNGEEKLVVHGYVENLGETGANVPQVQVRIVDKNGAILDEWVVDPIGLIIRKQGRAPFSSIRDVPIGIANVEASVIEGSKSSTSGEYP